MDGTLPEGPPCLLFGGVSIGGVVVPPGNTGIVWEECLHTALLQFGRGTDGMGGVTIIVTFAYKAVILGRRDEECLLELSLRLVAQLNHVEGAANGGHRPLIAKGL